MLGWALRAFPDADLPEDLLVEDFPPCFAAGLRACFVAMSNSAYSGAALPFRGERLDLF